MKKETVNSEIIFIVEESPDGGYSARAAGESIFTQADTLDVLRTNIREAVTAHFEEDRRPKLIRLHHIKDEIIPV